MPFKNLNDEVQASYSTTFSHLNGRFNIKIYSYFATDDGDGSFDGMRSGFEDIRNGGVHRLLSILSYWLDDLSPKPCKSCQAQTASTKVAINIYI